MEPKQRSTESHGLGQSGYTAGREHADEALQNELVAEHVAPHAPLDEDEGVRADLATDNRFTGRGGELTSERERKS
jgi:hypothetical protein